MVEKQLRGRDIVDPRVLSAMGRVPRHEFVLPANWSRAYEDRALPIRENQTISQPYIVALMTQSAELKPTDRVLEVGTGSGYQAAVLGELVQEVYSIEIVESLAKEASALLKKLGYSNIHVKYGDGYKGWKEHAPFDAVLITAAAPRLPQPLVDQLAVGGRLVVPIDNVLLHQDLVRFKKTKEGLVRDRITGVQFVPMTGEIRK
ncbi:MAG: protein-L-isoaspartate(D-aspartate) O-methyltransferase [Candidatus Nitronauta litoralis]|uniref:Protein-L-isoaspartate O-methyltransferase n=1 Tax=Candidatus Nitronauta litoralis TaxID=2705533 RepID=A0A7T0BZF7_9BACT|nr:MAG: protein-L-isoaspartate(D-aspartate) O-methyltransferase [Candidatus Nitronauta litoralis]